MKTVHRGQTPLDSRQLNAFVTLARTGSYKQTAAELFLTHSAISHSIRALEREVGCRLLTKMGKNVVLTEMGEALLHHAEHGLKEFSKAREAIEDLRKWGVHRLRIGAGAAACRHLLPPVLAQARQQDPRLLVTARVIRPWESLAALANGELDLVLGEPQNTVPEIAFTPLFESPLRIVVAPSHGWATLGRVTSVELPKEPCLLTHKSHPTRLLIDRYFAAEELVLNVVAEIDSFDTIVEMVKIGAGISVLPLWAVQGDLAAGKLNGFAPGRRALNQTWGLYRWHGRTTADLDKSFRLLTGVIGDSPKNA